jgi:cytoskeleton protein RodZ
VAEDDLQTLGATLRQARESQALSLEEVEAQTRIRVKYLQALETGDFSVLPSLTHAKGFLRNYAQFLHLDANSIVASFGELTGSGGGAVTTVTASQVYETPPPPGPASPDPYLYPPQPSAPDETIPGVGTSSPLPARPTYIAPDQRVGPSLPRSMERAAPPAHRGPLPPPMMQPYAAEVLEPPAHRSSLGRILRSGVTTGILLVAGFAAIIWAVTTQLSQISVEDVVPTAEDPAFFQTFEARTEATASPTFVPTDTPFPDTGVQILGRVLLTITVEQRTWTLIVVDGQTQYEGQAEPGTVLQFDGTEEILVRTGNGAGLVVTYNGQDIGPLGERGEIVERIFTVGGQITPTPTPTITPTYTPVPTVTPRS